MTIKISTDGKFLIIGKLNFADDNLSISGRLYADLSRVTSGDVTVLFLADIPDQVQLLTLYGKLKMGFRDASGQEVTFTVPTEPAAPTGGATGPTVEIADPVGNGGTIDVATLRQILTGTGCRCLDVIYRAAPGATVDWLTLARPHRHHPGQLRRHGDHPRHHDGHAVRTDQADPVGDHRGRRGDGRAAGSGSGRGGDSTVYGVGYTTADGVQHLVLARDAETSPCTDATAEAACGRLLLAAGMRLTGANRLRYAFSLTSSPTRSRSASSASPWPPTGASTPTTARSPGGQRADRADLHRHRHHRRGQRPGQRRQHRHPRPQQPQLDRRRLRPAHGRSPDRPRSILDLAPGVRAQRRRPRLDRPSTRRGRR